ncbi:MAG TPA: glycosyltransferase family 39 protein [Aquifex aeolicus]|nr:glycosyltransferase family 39 protein [Aquifex aeolicus]
MKKLVILIFIAFLSMFPSINEFAFKFEETTRAIVAFEMGNSGNYFQPTILGENYYNKPPLFNWLVILSSKLLGWDIFTARATSLFFTLANTFLVFLFARKIFKSTETALLSSAIYMTFADILFWYGWLAEIDITLSFFVFLLFIQIYQLYKTQKPIFYYTSAVITGIIFMLKGFPAFAFLGLSLLALSIFERNIFILLNPHALASYFIAVVSSLWWIPLSENPGFYLRRLWEESFSRVESSKDFMKFIDHLITYPILNLKQLLPSSVFIIGILAFKRISLPKDLKFLSLLVFINYIPYWISATSRGRYILPLFTLVAIIFAYIIKEHLSDKWKRIFGFSLIFVIFLRFLYGFWVLPYLNEKKGNPKMQAEIAYEIVKDKVSACDCMFIKDFCLYLGFLKGKPILKAKYTKDWSYLFDCKERKELVLIREFYTSKKKIYLYSRYNTIYASNFPIFYRESPICSAVVPEGLY